MVSTVKYLFILILTLIGPSRGQQSIGFGAFKRDNGPPSSSGSAAPANPHEHPCTPTYYCKGAFLSLRNAQEGDVDAGIHTEHMMEAVASAYGIFLQGRNGNESKPLTVFLCINDSNISTPILSLRDAVVRGIRKGLDDDRYRLFSNLTIAEREAFHGNITTKGSGDRVDIIFSTPGPPLGEIDMDDILERAAEIYWNMPCTEGPICFNKWKLTLEVNKNHTDVVEAGSFQNYEKKVLEHFGSKNYTASDPNLQKAVYTEDGVQVSGYDGWFLLTRPLNHPALQLYIEAPTHEEAVKLGSCVVADVKQFRALNASDVDKFVH
ncbi:Phosphoglucosamine mutase [Corchorus capsularis]|uniref:Phosphoglucosamine mutase n=1 Tax=Corchorus capsularis TaxID=210143 RepID=A0A1R3IWT6_COCAP|nr:Phosphoglucosamine mutase [Corchorus capsularis]